MGIDPGTTNGIAIYRHSRSHMNRSAIGWDRKQIQGHLEFWKLLTQTDPDVVVCERFQHRANVPKAELDAVEFIGLVKFYCEATKKELCLQTASQAKGLWTDQKLKTLDLWVPDFKHAMDATRHILYYVTATLKDMRFASDLRVQD